MSHLLSLGHGYSARALSRRLLAQGWTVTGTTRSEEKAQALRDEGALPLLWPLEDLRPALARATHLLISIGPDAEGDPALNAYGAAIADAAPGLEWAAYLSTTGVYGDRQGDWVDEDSDCAPGTRRGQWRLAAEAGWRELAERTGLPLHVVRLAGIYGPGRGPFSKVRKGTARRVIKPGQVFSRIHVEDIASFLEASIKAPAPGIYNLCDDDPAPPQDVIAHAAELLGLPLPPAVDFDTAEMSPMARSFYAESKRVRNDRAKRVFGWEPAYPGYREGLAALLRDAGEDG